jgi:NADPH2:quinone reductase
MRAVQVTTHGGPEVLDIVDLPTPSPGPGELLVDVAAAGLNYIDTYQRSGVYPLPTPFILGNEGSGRVAALGPGVTEFAVGDRVAWSNGLGAQAEQAVIPASLALAVPDAISDEIAAALLSQGITAHYLVNSTYPVTPDDVVVVHAAAGGVGLLLTQLAKAKGATVIGTVSTVDKEKLARDSGADEVIRYTETDPAPEIRRLTDGQGATVVYDGVGKDTFEGSLASLRRRGTLVLYGASSGQVPPFDPQRLARSGSLFLTRPSLGDYMATRTELTWRATDLFTAIQDGTLHIHIGATYPLDQIRQAHQDLQGRRTTGKVLLIP